MSVCLVNDPFVTYIHVSPCRKRGIPFCPASKNTAVKHLKSLVAFRLDARVRLAIASTQFFALCLPHHENPCQTGVCTGFVRIDFLPAHADFFGRTDPESSAGFAMMRQNNILPRNGDDVLQRIRDGFQFDEVNSELVRRFERTYAANPAGFERTFNRGNKYLFHIINEVERRGMPTEIAPLPTQTPSPHMRNVHSSYCDKV